MNSSSTGMNSAKNSVPGSRRMCSDSLRATENVRWKEKPGFMGLIYRFAKRGYRAGALALGHGLPTVPWPDRRSPLRHKGDLRSGRGRGQETPSQQAGGKQGPASSFPIALGTRQGDEHVFERRLGFVGLGVAQPEILRAAVRVRQGV